MIGDGNVCGNLTTEGTIRQTSAIAAKGTRSVGLSDGRARRAGGAAFFFAVLEHPFSVSLAFTIDGPISALSVGVFFAVRVNAFGSGGRATVFVFLADGAARFHTVGDHEVFGAFFSTFTFLGPSITSVTRVAAISVTQVTVRFLLGTLVVSKVDVTVADRATRERASGKHEVGVSAAFTVGSPGTAERVGITAKTSFFDAEFGNFSSGSFKSSLFLEDAVSVGFALELGLCVVQGFLALFIISGTFFVVELFAFASFAITRIASSHSNGHHTCQKKNLVHLFSIK